MNPGLIVILIMVLPFVYPLVMDKRMKVSSYHLYIGFVLCMIDAMAFFLIGGWSFLANNFEKTAYFLLMCGCAVFVFVIGLINLRISARIRKRHDDIVSNGIIRSGKVFGYEEGDERGVSKPMVLLQVRYYDKTGQIRQVLVPTDRVVKEQYPLGGNVTIYVWNGMAAMEDQMALPSAGGESDLMMAGIDVYGTQPKKGTHCPNCGAVVNVPMHMRTKCPYCGTIVSFDDVQPKE